VVRRIVPAGSSNREAVLTMCFLCEQSPEIQALLGKLLDAADAGQWDEGWRALTRIEAEAPSEVYDLAQRLYWQHRANRKYIQATAN